MLNASYVSASAKVAAGGPFPASGPNQPIYLADLTPCEGIRFRFRRISAVRESTSRIWQAPGKQANDRTRSHFR